MITYFDHISPHITVAIVKPEDLKKTYKKEKDPRSSRGWP